MAAPRKLNSSLDKPAIVSSDGACEGVNFEDVTIGGVLIEEGGHRRSYFGFKVPRRLVSAWQARGNTQTIGQAVILPVLLAKSVWRKRLAGRRVPHSIGNESARIALVKGTSASPASAILLDAFWQLEAELVAASWFARVPSDSNVADPASRLDFNAPELAGAERVDVSIEAAALEQSRWEA